MRKLEFNTTLLDQYINILSKLSNKARKYLIHKLEESLDSKPPKKASPQNLFGAWASDETADELIREIYTKRSFNRIIEGL